MTTSQTALPGGLPAYILERSRCNVAMAASDGRTASGSRSIVFFMRRLSEGGVDESFAQARASESRATGRSQVCLVVFKPTKDPSRVARTGSNLALRRSPPARGGPTYLPTYLPTRRGPRPQNLPTYLPT